MIGITAEFLEEYSSDLYNPESLFYRKEDTSEQPSEECKVKVSTATKFAHPKALLNTLGRELMSSQVYQENVAACVNETLC